MEFCHIAPTNLINFVSDHPRHLVLAHLVESDPNYVWKYLNLKRENPDVTVLLDNSAYERHKQGKPMYPSERLIDLGKKINADYIVMSDYPGEYWAKTKDKAIVMAEAIHAAGFKTFYVPQSELGDIDGLVQSFKWAIAHPEIVDLIGVSILACPIALGLRENRYDQTVNGTYRMQRYLARNRVMEILEDRHVLDDIEQYRPENARVFHFLGMTEGPNEIRLVKRYWKYIASWDSSSAVWHGVNYIHYDESPTGLRNGKFEREVDFRFNNQLMHDQVEDIKYNIQYIDNIVEQSEHFI